MSAIQKAIAAVRWRVVPDRSNQYTLDRTLAQYTLQARSSDIGDQPPRRPVGCEYGQNCRHGSGNQNIMNPQCRRPGAADELFKEWLAGRHGPVGMVQADSLRDAALLKLLDKRRVFRRGEALFESLHQCAVILRQQCRAVDP